MTTRGRFALSPLGGACWGVALVAYLLVLGTGDGWLVTVVAAGAVLPVLDLAVACRGGGLTLIRASRAVAGQPAWLRLARTGRPRWEGDLVLTVFPAGGAVTARVHAGCDATTLSHPAGARGPMPPLRWVADSYGPLGLAARRRHGVDQTPVLVHPETVPPWTGRLSGPGEADGQPAPGAGTEPAGIRPWRSGDPARSVHWRATARRGIPVVREPERSGGSGVVVVAGRLTAQQERAVAVAAATGLAALERGLPVTLVSAAGTVHPTAPSALLDWFALLVSGPSPLPPPGRVLWLSADPLPSVVAA